MNFGFGLGQNFQHDPKHASDILDYVSKRSTIILRIDNHKNKSSRIRELWVWLRDPASRNKVKDSFRRISDINLQPSQACAHTFTYPLHTHTKKVDIHT